ncbi:MAG: hypothetical protein AB1634_05305 [Thermodesulfobacteriota bacterium]
MTWADLAEEIAIELELMQVTIQELSDLAEDAGDREPSIRDRTAAAAFLAQFYNGVENILKRTSRFHGVPLPTGETWHAELLKRFSAPGYANLPILLDHELLIKLSGYRKFRHVVHHGYGFQIEWSRLHEGILHVSWVFQKLKDAAERFLKEARPQVEERM